MKKANPCWTKMEMGYKKGQNCQPVCKNCLGFNEEDESCVLVNGEIDPEIGSCKFWAERRVKPSWKIYFKPPLDKKTADYKEIEGGGVCGQCRFYADTQSCALLRGDVDPFNGRCNAWVEADEKEC